MEEGSFSWTPLISQPWTPLYFISYSWLYVSEIIDTGKKNQKYMILFKQPHVVQQTSCTQCEIIWTKNTPKSLIEYGCRGKSIKKIKQMSLRANTNVSTSNSSRNASLESHFFSTNCSCTVFIHVWRKLSEFLPKLEEFKKFKQLLIEDTCSWSVSDWNLRIDRI